MLAETSSSISDSDRKFEFGFKEKVHSEMKISLIIKGILVTVPIRLISFRLFYFSWWKGYGKNPNFVWPYPMDIAEMFEL